MSTKPKLSERDLERTCTDLLALDGWRCLKTDPVSRREWGKGFGEKGMADCLYLRYTAYALVKKFVPTYATFGEILWIEWKSPKGVLKTHQSAWHMAERSRGALTWVAGVDFPATFDDFLAFYRASGLNRRPV